MPVVKGKFGGKLEGIDGVSGEVIGEVSLRLPEAPGPLDCSHAKDLAILNNQGGKFFRLKGFPNQHYAGSMWGNVTVNDHELTFDTHRANPQDDGPGSPLGPVKTDVRNVRVVYNDKDVIEVTYPR